MSLPILDEPHVLDAETVAAYQRDGHVLIRDLASRDEAAAFRPLIEETALDVAYDKRPLEERDTYGKAFLQSFNLWKVREEIATFTLARRFARVAAELMGVERVRLYHDQALCKEPGGGRTPWHQDQFYWPIDTDQTITMWMPLVDVPEEIGTMIFASGTHRLGDLRGKSISDESDREFGTLITERRLPTATYGAVQAGDATFHAGWTVHSAGDNPTDLLRTVMTIIYVADGARVPDELTPAQDFDRQIWLRGIDPGSIIDTDLNPVLG